METVAFEAALSRDRTHAAGSGRNSAVGLVEFAPPLGAKLHAITTTLDKVWPTSPTTESVLGGNLP